ncbi:MAG: hypothetical protein WBK55_03630 [Alphaproteobacteria bacterium]
MNLGNYIKAHSENIAGAVSLLGSSALMLRGDTKSIAAAIVFTAAELTLARYGHTTKGYAAGAVAFAVGDLTLAFSDSVEEGSFLQMTLQGMAAAWAVGALRYPFERAAQATKSLKLQQVADTLPAICGTANLALRLPGIFSALAANQKIVACAITAWAISDVLAGRLQERVGSVYRRIRPPTSNL